MTAPDPTNREARAVVTARTDDEAQRRRRAYEVFKDRFGTAPPPA